MKNDDLLDEKISTIIERCRGLPKGERVTLRRHMGEIYLKQKPDINMLVIGCVPQELTFEFDDTDWQNTFFVMCVDCWNDNFGYRPPEAKLPSPRRAVANATNKYSNPETGRRKFAEILDLKTGKNSRLYRELARYIQMNDAPVDPRVLLLDLNNWGTLKTTTIWANAYRDVTSNDNSKRK